MSRRLLQRGRYPKDASLYQNPSSVAQEPQASASSLNYSHAPQVPLYTSQPQFQVAQQTEDTWSQSTSQPLTTGHTQQPQSHWSGDSTYATQQEQNAWNWSVDDNVHKHSNNQPQQQQYSEVQSHQQTYQHNTQAFNSAPFPEQVQVNQLGSTGYMLENNSLVDPSKQNGNQTLPPPSWEAVAPNISQSEHLPWTYNVPQNTPLPSNEWTGYNYIQNSNYAAPQNWTEQPAVHWQESNPQNYYMKEEPISNFTAQPNLQDFNSDKTSVQNLPPATEIMENGQTSESCNAENQFLSFGRNENNSYENIQDYGNNSSALSSFFHHSIEDNIEDSSSRTNNEICETKQFTSHEDNVELLEDTLIDNGEVHRSGSFEHNVQIPTCSELPVEIPLAVQVAVVEEPLNQEVPEPNSPHSNSTSPAPMKEIVQESTDEPLNQQVPGEGISSIPIQERTPNSRDESLSKATVVQKKHEESLVPIVCTENHPGFQEVNLESVPDNLERPPEHDELKKDSALSASFRQHLRPEKENVLDTSKASLWDAFDSNLPCVLLPPTALPQPPMSTFQVLSDASKDEENKDSTDVSSVASMLEKMAIMPPVITPLQSVHRSTPDSDRVSLSAIDEPMVNMKNSATNHEPLPKSKDNKEPSPPKLTAGSTDKQREFASSSPLKEPRFAASATDVSTQERHPPFHSIADNEEHSRSYSDMRNRPYSHDYEHLPRDYRGSSQSFDRHPDKSNHRYIDNRFEERPPSERDHSRPSSRMSLDDSIESHGNHDRAYRKHYDYDRPPSRMSESGAYRRDGSHSYHDRQHPRGPYSREEEYYQRMQGYRGYNYDQYHAARQPYYGYYDPYRYNYSNYNYGFYDELYRNDPRYKQQIEEQYREYYRRMGYDTDYERSSVHSGRSSANELSKDTSERYMDHDGSSSDIQYLHGSKQQSQFSSFDVSDGQQSTPAARLTPAKFNSPHALAKFTPSGHLLTLIPKQFTTGLPPPIEIHDTQVLLQEEPYHEDLTSFQGPLIRGETHKNDIIEFCVQKVKFYKQKEDIPDRESYILLWELLILLLRQNGSVAGSDIAELLLKDHEVLQPPTSLRNVAYVAQSDNSPAENSQSHSLTGDASSPDEGIGDTRDKILNATKNVDVEKVTRKFREFLLFGHKKDALEWAMKHDLWGHALFLASKMDVRTYANVMTRFANSLALNDPLQTLYQLMSGRQPAAVTCVADKQWGDWRPHLAMILSNPSSHPEVDSKSITSLGDTLSSQGCLPATHFCYLMAQVEFGSFAHKNSKMVLLCADHQLPFELFATNEAIQCTEIYEYAQSLANPGFMLHHLQAYKFIYATRLADHGFLQEALHYCEVLTTNFLSNPSLFPASLIAQVYQLATKLKYNDPHYFQGQGELEDQEDPAWLKGLAALVYHVQHNEAIPSSGYDGVYSEPVSSAESHNHEAMEGTTQEAAHVEPMADYYAQYNQQDPHPNAWTNGSSLQTQQPPTDFTPYTELSTSHDSNQYTNNYSSNQWNINSVPTKETTYQENQNVQTMEEMQPSTSQHFSYYGNESQRVPGSLPRERTISNSSMGYQNDRRDSILSSGSEYGTNVPSAKIASDKSQEKTDKQRPQVGRSWLGGIFSKFLPKAPNQMILPDDKNPTIIWDSSRNCWINNDTNEEEITAGPVAPPKDADFMGKSSPESSSAPILSPVSMVSPPSGNKFQRAKVKGMRQNYVDILNKSNSTVKTPTHAEGLFPLIPMAQNSPKVFVPSASASEDQPVMDFVSTQQNSFGMTQSASEEEVQKAPPMFDPAEFDSRRSSGTSVRHSIGQSHRKYPT